jgi:hypothetical protein
VVECVHEAAGCPGQRARTATINSHLLRETAVRSSRSPALSAVVYFGIDRMKALNVIDGVDVQKQLL